MNFEKQAALASRLFCTTRDGLLNWTPAGRPNAFKVALPHYAVVLSYEMDSYFIEVQNAQGETADVFDDTQLNEQAPTAAPLDASWHKTMCETYRMARRAGLGADKALDDVLKALAT